jgi:hypothetical protein
MNNKTAYPLCWPSGWPRTEVARKENGKFKQSLAGALNNLKVECERLGGKNLILSSNYTLGNERPAESGVVAYFDLDSSQIAIPCDRWKLVEHNVQAIALTIEAMRGMERWGAKHMIKAMFTGFKALPQKATGINPMEALGLDPAKQYSEADITAAFRQRSKLEHPDMATGSHEKFAALREAHDLAMATVRK